MLNAPLNQSCEAGKVLCGITSPLGFLSGVGPCFLSATGKRLTLG